MTKAKASGGRPAWLLLAAWGLVSLMGCGGPKRVPVSGQVTLGDRPVTTGRVFFSPDVSKGNNARVACVGRIDDQGRYELHTTGITPSDSGTGAPPGWYKVTIREQGSTKLDPRIESKYLDESKTPLSIEVVVSPAPDAYNLDLSK